MFFAEDEEDGKNGRRTQTTRAEMDDGRCQTVFRGDLVNATTAKRSGRKIGKVIERTK